MFIHFLKCAVVAATFDVKVWFDGSFSLDSWDSGNDEALFDYVAASSYSKDGEMNKYVNALKRDTAGMAKINEMISKNPADEEQIQIYSNKSSLDSKILNNRKLLLARIKSRLDLDAISVDFQALKNLPDFYTAIIPSVGPLNGKGNARVKPEKIVSRVKKARSDFEKLSGSLEISALKSMVEKFEDLAAASLFRKIPAFESVTEGDRNLIPRFYKVVEYLYMIQTASDKDSVDKAFAFLNEYSLVAVEVIQFVKGKVHKFLVLNAEDCEKAVAKFRAELTAISNEIKALMIAFATDPEKQMSVVTEKRSKLTLLKNQVIMYQN
jgi:hypothetical protein